MIFPPARQLISISSDIFRRLGYDGECYLSATANSPDNYRYNMKIYGQEFEKNDTISRNNDSIRLNICGGNSKKSVKLTQNISTAMKIAIIIAKGWGDKLQVFIAYICKLMNANPTGSVVAVATCDEVVFNLCCYFSIACLLTSTGVGTIGDNNHVAKINKILHYEPEGYNPQDVVAKLTTVYTKTKN